MKAVNILLSTTVFCSYLCVLCPDTPVICLCFMSCFVLIYCLFLRSCCFDLCLYSFVVVVYFVVVVLLLLVFICVGVCGGCLFVYLFCLH